jgi:hypothetical protein
MPLIKRFAARIYLSTILHSFLFVLKNQDPFSPLYISFISQKTPENPRYGGSDIRSSFVFFRITNAGYANPTPAFKN